MDLELERLQDSLLWRVHVELSREDGDEAFERHILLAVRINRAALLWGTGNSDQRKWVQFLTTFFPGDRYTDDVALLLWTDWRNGLVKDGSPRSGVAVAHRHREWHLVSVDGPLVVNLESMCEDFDEAVHAAVASLEGKAERRTIVLIRWKDWEVRTVVRPISPIGTMRMGPVGVLPVGETRAVGVETHAVSASPGGLTQSDSARSSTS